MKNKRCDCLKSILAKNARSSGNSIIHNWISMSLADIRGTTPGVAALRVNSGAGCAVKQYKDEINLVIDRK